MLNRLRFKKKVKAILVLLSYPNLLFLGILICSCNTTINNSSKPNIIIYLADDLGWKDVGFNNAKVVKTPNIDKLASEGMVVNNAFVASPACAPSRAALLTGLMPARNGAENNHTYPKEEINLLTKKLQQNGYKIYAFGKIAHGKMNPECGFDYYNKQLIYLEENVKNFLNRSNIEGPICIMIGDRRPHVPWTEKNIYNPETVDLPEYFIDTKQTREHRARYYSDISGFDKTLGGILDFLEDRLGKNTFTLMSSDHGGQWPFGKWNLYDDGIRTPLIIKWPDKIQANTSTNAMVSWIDIFPTLIELTGSKNEEDIDGKSFLKVLMGKSETFRDEIFTTHNADGVFNIFPIRSVRTKKYKYIRNFFYHCYHTNHSDLLRKDGAGEYWNSWYESSIQNKKAKQIISKYYIRPPEEFYDLLNDPNEQNNLIDNKNHRGKIIQMRFKLDQWMKKQKDQVNLSYTPYPITEPIPKKLKIEELNKEFKKDKKKIINSKL